MSTDQSTITAYNQNAYAYSGRMRSGKNYAHTFIEKPAMSSLLDEIASSTDFSSLKILLLGCGSGEEIDLLREKGALDENIIGIDISSELIKIAQTSYPEVSFFVQDMEDLLLFGNEEFDLVYSSLALHYIEDWTKVLREINRVLKSSGNFIFSTHHPIKWSATTLRTETYEDKVIGIRKFKDEKKEPEIFGTYLTKSQGEANWFNGKMKIKFFNRSIGEMFSSLKNANFQIKNLLEPKVSDQVKELDFNFWKKHKEIPSFVIFNAQKI